MERWRGRVALVTGASAGIGAATARALVRHGMVVIGCARRLEKIEAIQKELETEGVEGKFHPIRCDVSKKEEIAAMFKEIKREYKVVDVCINSAGVAFNAPLVKGNPDQWKAMLDVNVMGLCQCTQESVKLMLEAKVDDGQIIHLNSMSGHRVTSFNFYSATKFMVTALTEGLRRELRALKTKIRVCAISPGVVDTEFIPLAHGEDPATSQIVSKMPSIQADDVADQVIHILKQPPHVQIHDILLRPTEQSV